MNTDVQIKMQWIKGDKIGNVETIKEQDSEWTIFDSGGRISNSLLDEFLFRIDHDDQILSFKQPNVVTETKTQIKEGAPLLFLFEKMTNCNDTELELVLNFKLPKPDVLNVLYASFDSNDLKKALREFIKKQISIEDIMNILNEQIDNLIDE